jgi:hypothetical protein
MIERKINENNESQKKSRDKEMWVAGGLSLWLVSSELTQITEPIARKIFEKYPQLYPVTDAHVTIKGDIGKNESDESKKHYLYTTTKKISEQINLDLKNQPIELLFVK